MRFGNSLVGGWLLFAGIVGVVSCGEDDSSDPGAEDGGEGGEGATGSGGSGKGGSSGKGGTGGKGGSSGSGNAGGTQGGESGEDGGSAGGPESGGSSNGGEGASAPVGGEGGTAPIGGQGGEGGAIPVGGEGGQGGPPPVSCEDAGGCYDNDPCSVDLCPNQFCAYEAVTCSAVKGGVGGTALTDLCPDGQVVIGYEGRFNNALAGAYPQNVTRLATICGAPVIPDADGPVTVTQTVTLPMRGAINASSFTRLCPTDQVVVGFAGAAVALMRDIIVHCAPVSVTGGQISIGASSALPDLSDTDEDLEFPLVGCPTGQVARGSAIRAGDVIDGFGLVCTSLPEP